MTAPSPEPQKSQPVDTPKRSKGMLAFYVGMRVVMGMGVVALLLVTGYFAVRAWTRAQAQENEPEVVRTLEAYCAAQVLYHRHDWDGDSTLEYADRFRALSEHIDGAGGPLYLIPIEFALASGKKGVSSRGYLFDDVNSIAGLPIDWSKHFALCATPGTYGKTGIHTLLVTQDKQVWGKDLGQSEFVKDFPADPAAEGWEKCE